MKNNTSLQEMDYAIMMLGDYMFLSKSKYCQGYQCKKILWLDENNPKVKEDIHNDSVFETGEEVGKYAKELFGSYINIEFNENLNKMLEDTKTIIKKEDTCNITEASFLYNNNFCSVDILRKKNNIYEIYEVKSSTEVKDIYLEDASYQQYVLSNLGYDVKKVCIVYINNQYVRKGKLDLQELFKIEEITEIAKEKQKDIKEKIQEIQDYMKQKKEPKDTIGIHCMDPYPCPYFSYCTRNLKKPNIFNIHGMNKFIKFKLYNENHYTYLDLIHMKLNKKYLEQIDFELNNREPKIEINKIQEFLSTLSEPLYFLDFETFQQAIPLYDGISPYEQIPFQYSIHYFENGILYHKEFLAEAGKDPRRSLAERLVQDIPENTCTVAYNMRFEKGVILRLAKTFPDLKNHLMNIHNHMKDLMIPFQNRDFYTKDMEGSYSIKYVLPALFPNDSTLNYHNLEGIHNGSEAMNAFANMDNLKKDEQEKIRHNLLKYCELDTYAMVKIYQKLKEVTK